MDIFYVYCFGVILYGLSLIMEKLKVEQSSWVKGAAFACGVGVFIIFVIGIFELLA